jgi:hypothetical protein
MAEGVRDEDDEGVEAAVLAAVVFVLVVKGLVEELCWSSLGDLDGCGSVSPPSSAALFEERREDRVASDAVG